MSKGEREEQHLLYQAIKNSLVETKNINFGLEMIEEMPVFYPTEKEFKDPMLYIDKLFTQDKVWQAGTIKIVPPPSFKPTLAFDKKSKAKLPTRYQVLQQLSQGVPFNQNVEGHTFEQFEALANKRE